MENVYMCAKGLSVCSNSRNLKVHLHTVHKQHCTIAGRVRIFWQVRFGLGLAVPDGVLCATVCSRKLRSSYGAVFYSGLPFRQAS